MAFSQVLTLHGKNLRSLTLCFAAIRSTDTGKPQIRGKILRITLENSFLGGTEGEVFLLCR